MDMSPFPARAQNAQFSLVVDGKNIALRHGTGVATYARSLCRNLATMNIDVDMLYGEHIIANASSLGEEMAFTDARPAARRRLFVMRYIERLLRVSREAVPVPLRFDLDRMTIQQAARVPQAKRYWNAPHVFDTPPLLVERGHFQSICNVMNADAAHWTYPVPSRLSGAANIYTLHDLVPLKLPETTLDNKRAYYAMIRKITQTADLIVTVSEQSKADIHALFDIADDRVVNTYQDVDIPGDLLGEGMDHVAGTLAADFGLEMGRFLLFYGAVEPKKNVGRLIEAHLSSGLDIPLVVAGKDGWLIENELRAYHAHLANPGGPLRILRLPYVTRAQLVRLTRGALAVTFRRSTRDSGCPWSRRCFARRRC